MSSNEILWIAVVSVLLLSGVMFRIALHYRAQVKALSEEIQYLRARVKKVNTDFILGNRNITYECDADIGKSEAEIKKLKQEIKERDEEIKQLKQKTEEHEKAFRNVSEVVMTLEADVQSRDAEIQRLTQKLKSRDEAVKAPAHKNKKSKKKGK
ncbi:hypothetical protein [Bartonella sp. CM31XJBT]|uniref:hypothetical protein n=1 Tax=Bartonella sp. CM31XJBT TaxID=3019090 RepID=UPI0023605053|nr:hypothetical protein [Bartonella sp. CM31XJBT]